MTDFSRRDFFKIEGSTQITAGANSIGSKVKVYFTKQND